ncbi:hypothetical protein Ccrd_012103, partial [Cynara cardunculus var. scolymus]
MSFPMEAIAKRVLSMETPMGVPWKFPPCKALFLATSIKGLSLTELISLSIIFVDDRITSICGPSHWGELEEATRDTGEAEGLFGIEDFSVGTNSFGVGTTGEKSGNVGQGNKVAGGGDGATESGLKLKILPNELLLKCPTLLRPPVRGSSEAGGNTVTISSFAHALHHPVTTGLHPSPRRLRQLHFHHRTVTGSRDSSHLRHRQSLSSQLHHRLPELRNHSLHLIKMAPRHRLCCHTPVQW